MKNKKFNFIKEARMVFQEEFKSDLEGEKPEIDTTKRDLNAEEIAGSLETPAILLPSPRNFENNVHSLFQKMQSHKLDNYTTELYTLSSGQKCKISWELLERSDMNLYSLTISIFDERDLSYNEAGSNIRFLHQDQDVVPSSEISISLRDIHNEEKKDVWITKISKITDSDSIPYSLTPVAPPLKTVPPLPENMKLDHRDCTRRYNEENNKLARRTNSVFKEVQAIIDEVIKAQS